LPHEIGSSIGDYRLIKAIGSGACGEVFQAEHVITRRVEAIKLLARPAPVLADDDHAILREIEIQASLQHPNIAAVHNAFRVPQGLALVMELVEGEPLSAILDRDGVSLSDGTRYVLVTLDALAYAHERRVVHRDVKPSNIIITPQGSVKLTDFGLARSLDDGQALSAGIAAGSPYYMSPEQVVGDPADERSDCYSVGAILFEVATGRKPFLGDTSFEVMLQQRDAAPPPPISLDPRIGEELNAVILKALEKDAARRFQSAAEFRRVLERALAACPALREDSSPSPRRARLATARWAAAAAFAGLAFTSAVLVPSLRRQPARSPSMPTAPPAVPAPVPAPETAPAPPEPVAETPQPVEEPEPAAPARKPARRASETRPRPEPPLATSVSISPAPEPPPKAEPQVETPAAPPSKPEVAPAHPVVPHVSEEPAPQAAPADAPVKRPGLLRRALGRITRPFSGKKPDKPDKP
jgi:serine/threonine-protein kinase